MTSIPTTQQNIDNALSALESNLNQTSPLFDKAFQRVLAAILGMDKTELYKFGIERVQQVLALTATGDDLDSIGENYGLNRKAAQTSINTILTGGTVGLDFPITTTWLGQVNNIRYFQDQTETVGGGGTVSIDISAEDPGVSGNMQIGDLVDIGSTLDGLNTTGEVTAIVQNGSERETDDEYRIRILDEIQTVGGGSNLADYRTWGQEAANVKRVYPYSGTPPFSSSQPGYRTSYVEATTSFDPDGIPDQAILDDVREKTQTDPETGKTRWCLGSTDDTFEVLAITRTEFIFAIAGLSVDPSQQDDAEADIQTALDEYAASLTPFIDGLDPETLKNNVITSVAAGEVVQDVMKKYAGYTEGVSFGITPGVSLPSYELNPGELAKALITYV